MLSQFKSIIDLLEAFPDEQSCIDHLTILRWGGHVISPFDTESRVYKCRDNKYRCKRTGKYFNVRTGTIFGDTKLSLRKWFIALYIFSSHKKGISSHQLARDLDVTQKTAWFILHRLRYAFSHPSFQTPLGASGEIVQADETFIGGKQSNRHQSAYAKRQRVEQGRIDKKAGKTPIQRHGRTTEDKIPVIGVITSGVVIAKATKNVDAKTLKVFIDKTVVKGSTLVTDQYRGYVVLGRQYKHETVQHNAGEYARDGFHINAMEGFWSHLKRGIYGIYHHVSAAHLQAYVTEFAYRYNTRRQGTQNRFDMALANTPGKRLTYAQLISHE